MPTSVAFKTRKPSSPSMATSAKTWVRRFPGDLVHRVGVARSQARPESASGPGRPLPQQSRDQDTCAHVLRLTAA